MENDIGKVVSKIIYHAYPSLRDFESPFKNTFYDNNNSLKIVSESFTDYFVQWGSIAIVQIDSPCRSTNGYIDLLRTLPKHSKCLSSILLPQYQGWNIGNYAPIYFSMETHTSGFPAPMVCRIFRDVGKKYWDSTWPTPPSFMMGGLMQKFNVHQHMNAANGPILIILLKSITCKSRLLMIGQILPHINPISPNLEILKNWTELGVKHRTMKILFEKLRIQLPVILYLRQQYWFERYLYYYKCFLDHLQALDINDYKYDLEELNDFGDKVHDLLIA
ncbi:hypothetical protein INT43_002192 [Umbelopsis isabellina]|uniref:Uncharacterized protein n=1 Tax=Mortierella isabellina TaxID=91625 RepID=A0A8H7Q433_MORIS|nr:hypothetical protein INT43_002192 [Umbelopsis isabellina]